MDETEGEGESHAAAGNTIHQGATAPTFKSKTHCLCSSGLHHVTHGTKRRQRDAARQQSHGAYYPSFDLIHHLKSKLLLTRKLVKNTSLKYWDCWLLGSECLSFSLSAVTATTPERTTCCQLTREEIKAREKILIFWVVDASAPQNYSCVCEAGLQYIEYRLDAHPTVPVCFGLNTTALLNGKLNTLQHGEKTVTENTNNVRKNRLRVNEWMNEGKFCLQFAMLALYC